jgi:hypothetical protein
MSKPADAHLPFEPLRLACGASSLLDAARMLDRHPRQISRWVRDGITANTADTLAVQLGCHPVDVWPDWYEVTAPEAMAS